MGGGVECHAGAEYPEYPTRFFWNGTWRVVTRLYAERRTPQKKQFDVIDQAGQKFHLEYDFQSEEWMIRPA